MPRTFSEQEREVIKKSMLKVGAALLRKKGLRQISVEDITKGANIAKGSFYSFYNSREELFWDIIKMEETQLIDRILSIAVQDLDIKTKVRRIFYDVYLKEDSIVFYLPPKDIEYVTRKLPQELLLSNMENSNDFNQRILSIFQLDESEGCVEILRTMEDALLFVASSKIPQTKTTRNKVLSILVEALADYLSGMNNMKETGE